MGGRARRHLNCFGPNINIFRDPRWGRGHETFGEDPYLTGTLSAAFMRGLQSNDSTYVKARAAHAEGHARPLCALHVRRHCNFSLRARGRGVIREHARGVL
jgi:beta-glucosidase-like glycosyl hydrolase